MAIYPACLIVKTQEVILQIKNIFRLSLLLCVAMILYLATTSANIEIVSNSHDKLNHMFAFWVLTFLADMSFGGPAKHIKSISSSLLLYGLMIELIQSQLPYRSFSLVDIAADATAILLYWFVAKLVVYHLKREN